VPFDPDPRIVEILARLDETGFEGEVWKHTLPGQPPEAANTKGARWNPPDVPAIYVALERATATAEGDHLVSMQPRPIRGARTLHRGRVTLRRVLDLRDPIVLNGLGVGESELSSADQSACRQVGGAAEWLGFDGLIVPSARGPGANLVIFERRVVPDFELLIAESSPIPEAGAGPPER